MLKDTQRFPPRGWEFFEPATGWSAPYPMAESFEQTVDRIIQHRLANSRFGLATSWEAVAAELEAWTCARLKHDPHWCVGDKKKAPAPQRRQPAIQAPPSKWSAALARLAGAVREARAGSETLADWLGDGANPVAPEVATSRSARCVKCPLNNQSDKGWWETAKSEIAEAIKAQTALKAGANLATPFDSQLGTCDACGCHLPLKVWVPLRHITGNMTEDVKSKLDAGCWVTHEAAQHLLVVIPYCTKDYSQAVELVKWVGELGGCHDNEVLLVADPRVGVNQRNSLEIEAARHFRTAKTLVAPPSTPSGWPAGPNAMWQATLKHVNAKRLGPFYWMEPDCIPLRGGWLQALESEYFACGKPFMGAIVHSSGQPNVPGDHLTGCAIYPENAHDLLKHVYASKEAFDMAMAAAVVPLTHPTKLHNHFWGSHTLSPTFKVTRDKADPVNTLLVDGIPRECVVHHRCKDSSLINLLRSGLKC